MHERALKATHLQSVGMHVCLLLPMVLCTGFRALWLVHVLARYTVFIMYHQRYNKKTAYQPCREWFIESARYTLPIYWQGKFV